MQEISLTFALVRGVRGQGVPKEAILAAVAVEASSVVDALEALAGLAVTVAHGVGVDVVVALAQAAGPHSTIPAQWVSEIGIITQLTPLAWDTTQTWVMQLKALCCHLTRIPFAVLSEK